MSSAAKKILFVTLSNIGDVVLTLPVLDRLKQIFPGCRVTVVVGPRARELFAGDASVEKVIAYDKHAVFRDKVALLRSLSAERFDAVVDLRNSLFGYLVPARLKSAAFGRALSGRHMKDRHLAAISRFPQQPGEVRTSCLKSSAQERAEVERLLAGCGVAAADRLVLVCAGSRSLTKRWPYEHFARLCSRLASQLRVVLVGDDYDVENNARIAAACPGTVDLTGKTGLRELIALVRRADLIITNDSATLHLGSYLNRPLVALFGPTDEASYGPWSQHSAIIRKPVACRPCRKALCPFGNVRCLTLIRPEEVFQSAMRLLTHDPAAEQVNCPAKKDDVRRILIVRTDKLGDVILSTPVFQAVRLAYPRAYIALMVRPYTVPVVEGNPFIDEIILYDKAAIGRSWCRTFEHAVRLRKERFDLAIVLHPSIRNHLLTVLAGIPRRIGYSGKASFLLTRTINNTKHLGLKHEVAYNLDIIRALGIEPHQPGLFLHISDELRGWADRILAQEGVTAADRLVVMHPGTNDPSRTWLAQRYAQVADALVLQRGCRIMICSGEPDRAVAEEVIRQMREPAIDMIAKATIMQEAALLQRAAVFISTDTGPMHIASALGVPVVALFGRKDPGVGPVRWGPLSAHSRVIQKDAGCRQCLTSRCTRGFLCLRQIEVGDVVQAVEAVLDDIRGARARK